MVVMEDVTEEERLAELYVSVHGSLDHTFLKRGGGGVIPFSDKISKVVFDVAKCFWFVCFGVCIYVRITLSMKKPEVHTCSAEKLTPLMHKFRLKLASRMQDDLDLSWTKTSSRRSKRSAWASSTGDLRDGRCRALPPKTIYNTL